MGPNKTSILGRIGVPPLVGMGEQEQDAWVIQRQIERTTARALGGMKRKAKAPKVPKPRRHKNHCYCTAPAPVESTPGLAPSQGSLICCRCMGAKCIKPKPSPKGKKKTKP
jgi:hypothetical protein